MVALNRGVGAWAEELYVLREDRPSKPGPLAPRESAAARRATKLTLVEIASYSAHRGHSDGEPETACDECGRR